MLDWSDRIRKNGMNVFFFFFFFLHLEESQFVTLWYWIQNTQRNFFSNYPRITELVEVLRNLLSSFLAPLLRVRTLSIGNCHIMVFATIVQCGFLPKNLKISPGRRKEWVGETRAQLLGDVRCGERLGREKRWHLTTAGR